MPSRELQLSPRAFQLLGEYRHDHIESSNVSNSSSDLDHLNRKYMTIPII